MPINKAARFRYEIIDECLRNTLKRWSKAELLKYVNRRLELHYGEGTTISASQLRYDLENMQLDCGAPIDMYKHGKSFCYRYEDSDFSIKSIPVDEADILKLNDAVQLLQQIKGFTIADEIADIVKRLESRYRFAGTEAKPFISFETAPAMQGIENLEDIYRAIVNKKVLKIMYQTFHGQQPRMWQLHPYLLKEYKHRWYLFSYAEEKENVGVFALDRMKDIRVSRLPYRENTFVSSEDYFRDVIGITVLPNQSAEDIELLFSARINPYILTGPLHHSQQVLHQDKEGNLRVRYRLMVNPELISVLLSYGRDVQVLQPKYLADEIWSAAAGLLEGSKLQNN